MTELINTETGEVIEPMTASEASNITEEIAGDLDAMADQYDRVMPKIREAMTRQAWKAIGYRSGGEYVAEEFGGALQRLGVEARRGVVRELADAGMTTRAIAPVVGVSQKTADRDVRATESDDSVDQEPAPVIGINGKRYQRPKPQPAPVHTRQESVEERDARAEERTRELFCTHVAECLRYLEGGAHHAERFLEDAYPREADYLPPGMRLTRDRVDASIQFLQTIRDEVTR